MTTPRLPKSRMTRDIRRVEGELNRWFEYYRQCSAETGNPWLAHRFDQRAAAIHDAIAQLQQAAVVVTELPRTSI